MTTGKDILKEGISIKERNENGRREKLGVQKIKNETQELNN